MIPEEFSDLRSGDAFEQLTSVAAHLLEQATSVATHLRRAHERRASQRRGTESPLAQAQAQG